MYITAFHTVTDRFGGISDNGVGYTIVFRRNVQTQRGSVEPGLLRMTEKGWSCAIRISRKEPDLLMTCVTLLISSIFLYKQNRSTEGCSKLKRSVDMTSSGKNGLNIRTNASPKWDRTRCPEE